MCLPYCPAHCPSFSHSGPVSSLILLLCYSVLLSVCPSYLLCPSICPPRLSQNPSSFFILLLFPALWAISHGIFLSCSLPLFFLIAMLCCCPDLFSSSHPHLVLIFLCPFCLSSLPCVSRWDSPRGRWCCLQVSCFSGGLGSAGLMVGL